MQPLSLAKTWQYLLHFVDLCLDVSMVSVKNALFSTLCRNMRSLISQFREKYHLYSNDGFEHLSQFLTRLDDQAPTIVLIKTPLRLPLILKREQMKF